MSTFQLRSYLDRENALAESCGSGAQNSHVTVVGVPVLVVIIAFSSTTRFSGRSLIQLPLSSKSFDLVSSLTNAKYTSGVEALRRYKHSGLHIAGEEIVSKVWAMACYSLAPDPAFFPPDHDHESPNDKGLKILT